MNTVPRRSLAVVGAGPRAVGLLERLAANAPALRGAADPPLDIHLVDPYQPGPGRVWRSDQSALLRMNSMAEDVTLFTDNSCSLEGPVRPGPSLAQWASAHRDPGPHASRGDSAPYGSENGQDPHAPPDRASTDPQVLAELRSLTPTDFPSRLAQGAYLGWAADRVLRELRPWARIVWHRTAATGLSGPSDGPQLLTLADRPKPLRADLVVLCQGHLDAEPGPEHASLAAFAQRHGRTYLPPSFTADADLSGLDADEHVLVRGFGLAFVDLAALVTEGRGGRWAGSGDGELRYVPSGREPVLHVGSRRGVPYHSKTGYRLGGPRPPLPHHFGPDRVRGLLSRGRPLDLRGDVWPLMAKEIGFGHYHELFHAHPERTGLPWSDFLAAYDRAPARSAGLRRLLAVAVPDPADRFDPDRLDRPLTGRVFATESELSVGLLRHVTEDADRRADPRYSADLGAFHALLSVHGQLVPLLAPGVLTDRSRREDVPWWQGLFSFLASGPPGFRLRQLTALARAGVVRFLGPDLQVGTDEAGGTFTGASPAVPGRTVHGTALVEAYLPRPELARAADPLLRGLYRTGELAPERAGAAGEETRVFRVAQDGRIHDPRLGGPHPRRFATGYPTDDRAVAAFARPGTDAPAFRRNDTVARALLRALAAEGGRPARRAVKDTGPAVRGGDGAGPVLRGESGVGAAG